MNTMLKISQYVFWILIFYFCDESTILAATTPPVQTFLGWNASFSMKLDPYPNRDSIIQITKNGTLIIWAKGTGAQSVAERLEFTGDTTKNKISFILRNATLGDAGAYIATETGFPPGGNQILIVKVAPSKPQIVSMTGSAILGSDYRLNCSSVSNSVPPDHGLIMMSEWKVNDQLITTGMRYIVQGMQLTIKSLTRQDNNIKLTCVAYENSLMKSISSDELVIDVKYGPGNSVNLGSISSTLIVYLHQKAPDITCSATCNPPCYFCWYQNRTLYSNGTTLSLGVVENKASGGNYTCEAYNNILGLDQSSSSSININVYYVPEVPSNITIMEVTEDSVTVQWVAGYNGGPMQTFYVFVSAGDFTRNFTASDPGYGNLGTVVIKDLSASTRYNIYMSASNSVGTSNMTEVTLIITQEECASSQEVSASVGISVGGVVGVGVGGIVVGLIGAIIALTIRRKVDGPKNSCYKSKGKTDDEMQTYSNTEMNRQTVKPIYEELNKGNVERTVYEKMSPL